MKGKGIFGYMADYINWIRSKVGHEKVILVFAGGC